MRVDKNWLEQTAYDIVSVAGKLVSRVGEKERWLLCMAEAYCLEENLLDDYLELYTKHPKQLYREVPICNVLEKLSKNELSVERCTTEEYPLTTLYYKKVDDRGYIDVLSLHTLAKVIRYMHQNN